MKFKGKDASLKDHVNRLGAEHESRILARIAADARVNKPPLALRRPGDLQADVIVKRNTRAESTPRRGPA